MAKNIKGITVEIGGDTTKLGKAIQNVDKDTRSLQRELRGVNTLLKYDSKNVALTQQKQELLTKSVENTRDKLNTLKEAQAQVQAQFDKGEITAEQYRDFQREIAFTEQRLKDYERQLAEVSKEHRTLEQSLDITSKKFQDVGKKMSDVGSDMTKKFTLPIVAVGGIAAKLGIDFEKAMSEVAAVSGATGEDLKQLEKAARDAGATTDKSARDAADALQYMALAGWSVEDSQKALMPILKLSSAANMELGRTSDLVTDTMSVLGLEINDLDNYLDVLAETSRNSNTNVDQLGEAFLVVGGRLKMLDAPLDESATALGILADNGIKGSEAGRGLNAVLTNLTAPTGRAKEALKDLGISAFDSNGQFIGIEETLKLVESATKDMTQEQQNMYYSMIAGKEHGKTLTALMSGLGGSFTELKGQVQGADGALEEMYDTATDNTMGAINNLKSALEELALKIFENLKPAIDFVVKIVQGIVDWLNNLSPQMQQLIVTIGVIVAALGPVLFIGGKIIAGIGLVIGVIGKVIAAIKLVGGAIAVLSSTALLPVIAVVGAVVAAIVAIIAIIKNWGAITEWLKNIWASFTEWFSTTFDAFKEWAINLFTSMGEGIRNITAAIKDAVVNIFTSLVQGAVNIFNNLRNSITNVVNAIKNAAVNVFKAMTSGLINAITSLPSKVKELFNRVKNFIVNPLKSIKLGTIGRDIIMGLVRGITNSIGAVVNAVKNVASSIAGGFKKFFGIKSPSRLMRDVVGKMIPQGIAVGVEADTDEALDAVDDMNRQIMMASEPDMMSLMRGQNVNSIDPAQQATISIGAKLDRLVAVFDETLNKLSNPNYQMVLDTGVIVGEMKNEMDQALGNNQKMKGRGRE